MRDRGGSINNYRERVTERFDMQERLQLAEV